MLAPRGETLLFDKIEPISVNCNKDNENDSPNKTFLDSKLFDEKISANKNTLINLSQFENTLKSLFETERSSQINESTQFILCNHDVTIK